MKPSEKQYEAFRESIRQSVASDPYFVEEALTDLPRITVKAIQACLTHKDDVHLGALLRHHIEMHFEREADNRYEQEIHDFEANFYSDVMEMTR